MGLPHLGPIGKRIDTSQGLTDQIIPFDLFLKKLEKVRPHQGCQLIEAAVYGHVNPKLARFRAKVINVAIIVFQNSHKFFISILSALPFGPFCSQKTITTNFSALFLSGALITHKN